MTTSDYRIGLPPSALVLLDSIVDEFDITLCAYSDGWACNPAKISLVYRSLSFINNDTVWKFKAVPPRHARHGLGCTWFGWFEWHDDRWAQLSLNVTPKQWAIIREWRLP